MNEKIHDLKIISMKPQTISLEHPISIYGPEAEFVANIQFAENMIIPVRISLDSHYDSKGESHAFFFDMFNKEVSFRKAGLLKK